MRRPHLPRTVRWRLTGALAVVLTLALAVAAIVTVLVARSVLIGDLDAQLRAAGSRFAIGLEHNDHDGDNGYGQVEGQLAGTLGARVYNGRVTDAAIVGDHDNDDRVPAPARARLAGLRVDGAPQSVDLPVIGEYRVLVARGRDGDVQVTGLPLEPIEHTLDRLAAVTVLVFAVALLVIVLASTGLLRIMLRPLTRVSSTAAEVAELPLDTGGVSLPHRVPSGEGPGEIDTLARAFNAMLAQVESALRTRADSEERLRRFIADASHELRTPVTVVRGHAELARHEGGDGLAPDVAHSLGRIIAQSDRMGQLVEDLLLLARLDSGRSLPAEPVDIVRVALDAVDDARATHPGHRWRLDLPDGPVEVAGDRHALTQVLTNLLANAATHTSAGTTVTVTVRGGRVTVADDGPGMPDGVAERAFDRFVRGAGDRADTQGSSGLGLPIVAAIVAAHRGRVELHSDDGGTTVDIDLPAGATS